MIKCVKMSTWKGRYLSTVLRSTKNPQTLVGLMKLLMPGEENTCFNGGIVSPRHHEFTGTTQIVCLQFFFVRIVANASQN